MRTALYVFVWAMRRLSGQVYSYNRANDLGILPGSRCIAKRNIKGIHKDVVRGVSLLEGCTPISHLNNALHHFVHYGQFTLFLGILLWYWMMSFERYVCICYYVLNLLFVTIRLIHSYTEDTTNTLKALREIRKTRRSISRTRPRTTPLQST